ncbi:MAG: DoxX family protein [Lacibacter sp.]
MNKFLSSSSIGQNAGLALVRFVVGFFMIYHGWEIFNETKMNEYLQWDQFKLSSAGKLMVYAGKLAELIAGVLLFLGLLTRVASVLIVGTMGYIAFFVGHGRIWYEDQHPFLFVLLGIVFLFAGGGRWSADHYVFKKKSLYR